MSKGQEIWLDTSESVWLGYRGKEEGMRNRKPMVLDWFKLDLDKTELISKFGFRFG